MNVANHEETSGNGFKDAVSSIASLTVHADDGYSVLTDVAAPLHVSSTYKYPDDPSQLDPVALADPEKELVYSRYQTPNTIRAEAVLAAIMKGECLLYANGMAAIHAVFAHVNPRTLALADAYSGVITLSKMYTKKFGLNVVPLSQANELSKGDLIWLTTPVNPTGLSVDIEHYAAIAKKTGARVAVDSTFSPPPLSNPFDQGADIIIHSGSKYLGGHSDLLAGVMVVKEKEEKTELFKERLIFGTSLGNMETWLLLRSMRTLEMRVRQASRSAEQLALWLNGVMEQPEKHGVKPDTLHKVTHSSLQNDAFVKKQNPGGFGPVLSISLKDADSAKVFPSKLKYFTHATSLGGVESLIEWRTLSDPNLEDRALLRLSIGIENVQDLQNDILQALRTV